MPVTHIGATTVHRGHHVTAADLNRYGMMHGGRLLTLVDETGFLAARAFCGRDCLTVAVHRARFLRPVREGRFITATACVAATGRTSLWTPVRVCAAGSDHSPEEALMDAIVTYVAVDDEGRPVPVPEVVAATPAERRLQADMRRLMAEVRGSSE